MALEKEHKKLKRINMFLRITIILAVTILFPFTGSTQHFQFLVLSLGAKLRSARLHKERFMHFTVIMEMGLLASINQRIMGIVSH